jgi:hypothetical protein
MWRARTIFQAGASLSRAGARTLAFHNTPLGPLEVRLPTYGPLPGIKLEALQLLLDDGDALGQPTIARQSPMPI